MATVVAAAARARAARAIQRPRDEPWWARAGAARRVADVGGGGTVVAAAPDPGGPLRVVDVTRGCTVEGRAATAAGGAGRLRNA